MPIKWKYAPVLVDGSGSMEDVMQEAITGYRGHLKRLAESPLSVKVSLSIFDDYVRVAYTNAFVGQAKGLDECPEFDPVNGGNTALYDSIWEEVHRHEAVLAEVQKSVERREGDVDVVFGILTDGFNTHSTHTQEEVATLIERKRRDGWEFVFIGPSKDVGLKLGGNPDLVKTLGAGGAGIAAAFEAITETQERLLLGTGSGA